MAFNNKKSKKEIIYIGKQSYSNLGSYDYEYLINLKKNLNDFNITFFHSYLYTHPKIEGVKYIDIFKYNKKKIIGKIFSYIYSLIYISIYAYKKKPFAIHTQWFLLPAFDFIWIISLRLLGWEGNLIQTIHNAKSRNLFISKYFIITFLKWTVPIILITAFFLLIVFLIS